MKLGGRMLVMQISPYLAQKNKEKKEEPPLSQQTPRRRNPNLAQTITRSEKKEETKISGVRTVSLYVS